MSRNLYIADLHLGHQNCIGFDGRPFSSIDEHDKALVTNWNAVVMPDDHVYVVGDFAYRNEKPVSYYTSRLHGHIHLIRGNHDKRSTEYESCFESVDDILKIGDMLHGSPVEVIMCHYWTKNSLRRRSDKIISCTVRTTWAVCGRTTIRRHWNRSWQDRKAIDNG